jgi:hypothetical protein
VIGVPLNDRKCLAQVSEVAASLARNRDPVLQEIAGRFRDTKALASWIRSLPQKDDEGDPAEGPKVEACEPPQRLRIPAEDPNCVERAALYVAAAELIDPTRLRQLVTVDTPVGRHTFPVEDGEPVVLDTNVTRNALEGALFQLEGAAVKLSAEDAVDWVTAIAEEPATKHRNGVARVARARKAMRGVLAGRPLGERERKDVGYALALAEREAGRFGETGRNAMRTTMHAIDGIEVACRGRRNVPWGIALLAAAPYLQGTLSELAKAAGRIGEKAVAAATQTKLARVGIAPPVLRRVEAELRKDGLSLGALAKPAPKAGTLGALTTDVIAGQWLASKVL